MLPGGFEHPFTESQLPATWQMSSGWQLTVPTAVHMPFWQVATSQMFPSLQELPLAVLFGPVSTHTGKPVAHEIVPVSHGFVGVQDPPAVHGA